MKRRVYRICILVSLLVIILSTFVCRFYSVSGSSMEPTFDEGNIVFAEKITGKYERYDVVVVKNNGYLIIKRVIGLPGEKIRIEKGKVLINGKEIEDVAEGNTAPGIAEREIELGENEYFLLGDNREESKDSRDESIGVIEKKKIKGRIVFSLIPFGKMDAPALRN